MFWKLWKSHYPRSGKTLIRKFWETSFSRSKKCLIRKFWESEVKFSHEVKIHAFFISNICSTYPQCCLTFSWIELQMLLWCCLIHLTIIILAHILYLVHLPPYLVLGLFMSYLCVLSLIFSPIFVVINHITALKQVQLFLYTF